MNFLSSGPSPSTSHCRPVLALSLTAIFVTLLGGGNQAAQKSTTEDKAAEINARKVPQISFTQQIRPILETKCLECHDPEERKSNFEVTSLAALLRGGKKAGSAIIPGKPDESPLVQYIEGRRQPQMPKGRAPLSDEEIALFRMWIEAGAVDDSPIVDAGRDHRSGAAEPEKSRAGERGSGRAGDSKSLLNTALFSEDNEQLMILRRSLRLAMLAKPPIPPQVETVTFNPIDQFIAARWKEAGLSAAEHQPELCDDRAFLRRVYLDVIGVIPTVQETGRFLSDNSPDKRAKLVDELLARREDYAAHWTPFWEEALGSQTTRVQGGIPTRGNYRDWIFKSFANNRPFDLMVAELIDPSMPGHKQAGQINANGRIYSVAYIRSDTPTDTLQSAANVAQVFLGTGMKCASCHNHFLNEEWPQARFLAFAGLFAKSDLELVRCEKNSGKFIPAKFPFELPDAPLIARQNNVEARLHRVAQLLTDPTNPRFAKTIVNRLWKRYFGLGLFEPADDFRLDRPPSHPALLEWLADDFMRGGYDLKHTIRLILTSRTYQLRYDPKLEDHFDVVKPAEPRYYRSPSLRRLTAEQLIDSIRTATTQILEPRKRTYLDKISTALTRSLGRPASRNEISTGRPDDVAVLQALELLNGEEFNQMVYGGSILGQLARHLNDGTSANSFFYSETPPVTEQKTALAAASNNFDDVRLVSVLNALYLISLSRPASQEELSAGLRFLKSSLPPPSRRMNLAPVEEVWLDDNLPPGAKTEGGGRGDSWKWVGRPEYPVFSGTRAHTQGGDNEFSQHLVQGATTPLRIGWRDKLFTYVYLDPKNPPSEIMMQWKQSDWEHRAYWSDSDRKEGSPDPPSRHWMGPLPEKGEWVRLEVPVTEVGLKSEEGITGWSFDQAGGVVFWDKSGVVRIPIDPMLETLGDVLWALLVSPEFQYIR
ncbi:MAG TPA: PSD1 and planctomycete cytochrome C domain-containing protein [Acidobacteriota bacterium]|jgi:hypothetical protein